MSRRAGLTLALTFACAAPAAQATPPDMVAVSDQLFGISTGHVFILRQSHDNLGLYTSDMRAIALVAIDRATAKEQLWPVWQSRRTINDIDPFGLLMKADVTDLPDAVNPFSKLAEMGGSPVVGRPPFASPDLRIAPNTLSNAASLAPFTLEDGTRFAPDTAALLQGVSQSLDDFSAAMGGYERFGPLILNDLMAGQDYTDADCTFSDSVMLDGDGGVPVNLVLVTCPGPASDPNDTSAAMWKLVLPEPAK